MELISRKPRSYVDVARSPLPQSRMRRKNAYMWRNAISSAWVVLKKELSQCAFHGSVEPLPTTRNWECVNPDAAVRWKVVHGTVLARVDGLGIRQEILPKPIYQRVFAWDGRGNPEKIPILLATPGTRPW